jgi:hypothetical protein
MSFPELSLDQRRHLIDVQQRYEAWRTADRAFRESNKGSMTWKWSHGKQYLYRIVNQHIQKSIGLRTPEMEKLKQDYMHSRKLNRARVTKMRKGIEATAAMNRAMGLMRVPRLAANVLRALDHEGLLGRGLFIVGTHALYAYEAKSGIIFKPELLATRDLDLLADVRSRLVLALDDKRREGILRTLQKVDESFHVQGDLFRAVNDEGYYVDIIRPMSKDEILSEEYDLGGISPVGMSGLEWLVSSPRFEAAAIAEDGMPVWLSCIDPRAFALHKFWLSKRETREPSKRQRDAAQAAAVAQISELLGLKFDGKELSALPAELLAGWKALMAQPKEQARPPV